MFNLGSVWRLNDAGLLERLDRITSVSGGSILAGVLGVRWRNLEFTDGCAINFVDEIVVPIRHFCTLRVDLSAGVGIVNPLRSTSDYLISTYKRNLVGSSTLQDLPSSDEGPRFIFYATNYLTGVSFRFSQIGLADYKIGTYEDTSILVAQAIAASSSFPPVLSPFTIKTDPALWKGGSLESVDPRLATRMRRKLFLTDGGVYDNMGLEAVWDHGKIDVVLACDAGGPFVLASTQSRRWSKQLGRVRDILIEQTRALRKRTLVSGFQNGYKDGALWTIQTKIADFELNDPLMEDSTDTASLQKIRTRLNPFSEHEQRMLINWGYALTDAALRRHVDSTIQVGKLPV